MRRAPADPWGYRWARSSPLFSPGGPRIPTSGHSKIGRMSAFLERVVDCARTLNKRIVFPEGDDERVRVAAERLAREKVAVPILVSSTGGAVAGADFVDPKSFAKTEHYASLYYERRRSRGVTEAEARRIAVQPLYFSSLMVAAGDADGMVGGAGNTTAETVRAVIHCVGVKEGFRLVSSFMILVHPEPRWGSRGVIFLADPAVVPDPSASQLAEIAIAAAENATHGSSPIRPAWRCCLSPRKAAPSTPWWKRSSKRCASSALAHPGSASTASCKPMRRWWKL